MSGLFLLLLLVRCSTVPTEADPQTEAGGQLAKVLIIEPVESVVMGLGTTLQFEAIPENDQGEAVAGYSVDWSSSDDAVATVSDQGLATALSEGTVVLTASAKNAQRGNGRANAPGQLKKTATITVDPASVVYVEVSPASVTIGPNATTQLTATARDADGNELSGRYIAWSTSNSAVATVDGDGLVTGHSDGSSTIEAETEGKNDTALVAVQSSPPPSRSDLLPAFPGAEGYGAIAFSDIDRTNQEVLFVTNTNSTGPGSLYQAIADSDPSKLSIIIFRVAGYITPVRITKSNIYIAGQTAPGSGITFRYDKIRIREPGVKNIVIRYTRHRLNGGNVGNNLSIVEGENIILDHISASFTGNDNVEAYVGPKSSGAKNITMQRSIIGPGVCEGCTNPRASGGGWRGTHEYQDGNLVEEHLRLYNVDYHHNLWVNNQGRNPKTISGGSKFINNVVYNPKNNGMETRGSTTIDVINNYFKKGPASHSGTIFFRHEDLGPYTRLPLPNASIYFAGNVAIPDFRDAGADNWSMIRTAHTRTLLDQAAHRRYEPLPEPAFPITIESADAAYDGVLADVGANRRLDCYGNWVYNQDALDRMQIEHVKNGTGNTDTYTSISAAGGYPTVDAGTTCSDLDSDGMPDEFETRFGLNPRDATDASKDGDGDGYTNLEEFLNGTSPS